MKMIPRFIVMSSTASVNTGAGFRSSHYRNIAVVETDGIKTPTMIHPRHKAVKKIVRHYGKCYVGKTSKCEYARTLKVAEDLADKLNKE
jgi:hypothetical protein